MDDYLGVANDPVFFACGAAIILFILGQAALFSRAAYREGRRLGMERRTLWRSFRAGAISSAVPTLAVIVALVTMVPVLGVPVPWIRLSVIGSAPYELMAAGIGAKAMGVNGLGGSGYTAAVFASSVWVMCVGSVWSVLLVTFATKRLKKRVAGSLDKDPAWRNVLMNAAFLGVFSIFIADPIVRGGLPLATLGSSALIMALVGLAVTKLRAEWLREFALALSMIGAMGAAALLADQYVSVYRELEALSVSLERKVAERSLELESAVDRQRRLGAEIERKGRALAEAADASGRDLKIAERLQRGLFPARPPEVSGWDIALDYRPASGVSGDFYDFFVEGGELKGLAVGDVSGHGVGAGLIAVLARSVFARRFAALGQGALGDCLAGIHAELARELGGVDEYLTCLMLRIEGGRVEYANAAHPDLLFRRAGQDLARPLVPKGREGFRGPPLGKEGFEGSWTALRFVPAPGDILLAFTDCLEEARNAAGERYGRARLEASVGRAPAGSARELLDAVLGDIVAFAGSEALDDDLTAVVLRRLP